MNRMRIALAGILTTVCVIGIVSLFGPASGPVSAAAGPAARSAGGISTSAADAMTELDRPIGTLGAARNSIRADVLKLREKIRKSRLLNERLRLENRSLRNELRLKLAEAGKPLPPETLESLQARRRAIQALADALAETRGDIRAIRDTFPTMQEQRDWSGLGDACDRIIAIQAFRFDKLTQINALLKEMVKLVK